MNSKLPQFLVVGAARAGTTSLYRYLRQHPDIFMPRVKEPCFFCFANEEPAYKKGKFAFAVRDLEQYKQLFAAAREDQFRGECSTAYLYLYNKTIRNIQQYHPEHERLKIIILLRNPAERAFSQYLWRVRDGREELSFEEAIRQEPVRKKQGYSFDYLYVDRGFYFAQVRAYLDHFSDIKIVLFDDWKKDPPNTAREICRFIGAPSYRDFVPDDEQNASYVPRWKFLNRIVTVESRTKFRLLNQLPENWKQGIRKQLQQWNTSRHTHAVLQDSTRRMLQEVYRNDVVRLQDLIGRDLSAWLNHA